MLGSTSPQATSVSFNDANRASARATSPSASRSSPAAPAAAAAQHRLFTRHQAVALSAHHDHCAAEGCERPFAWCELHHLTPWAAGGATDLTNAVPLCGFHHRRVHDPHYTHTRAPDHTLRFTHQWPSRRPPQTLAA